MPIKKLLCVFIWKTQQEYYNNLGYRKGAKKQIILEIYQASFF